MRVVLTAHCGVRSVQKPTVVVLNLSLLGCIGCLVFLLTGAAQVQSWLVPHLAFLLVLAVGLWVSVNWCGFPP